MSTPLATEPSTPGIEAILTTRLPTSNVLGVRFHCLRIPEVIQVIERFIKDKTPRNICLANAYTLSLSWKDSELRQVLDQADLVLPDGMSIVWGGRWIDLKVPERVAGPDLMSE